MTWPRLALAIAALLGACTIVRIETTCADNEAQLDLPYSVSVRTCSTTHPPHPPPPRKEDIP
jgi:hypothetical protein